MTELALFASTFLLVFALGLQSLNVNNGRHAAALINGRNPTLALPLN